MASHGTFSSPLNPIRLQKRDNTNSMLAAVGGLLFCLGSVAVFQPSWALAGTQLFVQSQQKPVAFHNVVPAERLSSQLRNAPAYQEVVSDDVAESQQMSHGLSNVNALGNMALPKVLVGIMSFCAVVAAVAVKLTKRALWINEGLMDIEQPIAMAAATGLPKRKVAVTGAAGRTGKLVVEKLLQKPGFTPVCVVKREQSAEALRKLGVPEANIRIVSVNDDIGALAEALTGCDSLILCTSAVPKIEIISLVKIFVSKCLCRPPERPTFTFPEGGSPEEVDWIGTRNQVDAAKKAGVEQFVMVSSMGGTQPDNFLNSIGKKPDGSGGDILLWKRKGEKYLIDSGLKYTIIHPGGLLDTEGGKREIVFGVDDTLLSEKVRSIPRADVAEVCVQALVEPKAINRSFDIISRPEGEGSPTTDFDAFFSNAGDCDYS